MGTMLSDAKGGSLLVLSLSIVVSSAAAEKPRRVDMAQVDTPPNLVLVTISSLRADHVGCLGYHRSTTPNFDRFAQEGVLFRKAFATSSWTMPAHGSIFTALLPGEHGATHIDRRLEETHLTLAEILAANGYHCAGFCCNPRLGREAGFAQGFHLYDDFSVLMFLGALESTPVAALDISQRRTNALINDAAINWLNKNRHRPFFLFVHYYDSHWDYLPPAPYRHLYDPDYSGPIDGTRIAREPLFSNRPDERDVRHLVALYDGEVRQTDEDFGEILDVLKRDHAFENTIIVVMGDHGEQFYEHGNTSHHGLFDELIHIPLAISVPGLGPGRVTDALVSQIDLMPALLDCLHIPAPAVCRGASLRPLLEGPTEVVHNFIHAEYTGGAVPDAFAVRSCRYKCLWRNEEMLAYDLSGDPLEQQPLRPADESDELATLRKALVDWMPVLRAQGPSTGR